MIGLELTDDERQQIGDIRRQGFTFNFLYSGVLAANATQFQSQPSIATFVLPFPCLITAFYSTAYVIGNAVKRVIDPARIWVQFTGSASVELNSAGFDDASDFGAMQADWTSSNRGAFNALFSGGDIAKLGLIVRELWVDTVITDDFSIGEQLVFNTIIRLNRA